MNYSKDLLTLKKKSPLSTILGLISVLIAITFILIKFYENIEIQIFDWFYSAYFMLFGISIIMTGQGYSLDRLFGKAFIEITDNKIRLKTGVFDKLQVIDWDKVHSIEYHLNYFRITKKDKSTIKLSLGKLEHTVIQEIKETIIQIADNKRITTYSDKRT